MFVSSWIKASKTGGQLYPDASTYEINKYSLVKRFDFSLRRPGITLHQKSPEQILAERKALWLDAPSHVTSSK